MEPQRPPQLDARPRIAIVGAGAAGLAAMHALEGFDADVHVFEAQARLGGHAHTAHIQGASSDGATLDIDTAFVVFNLQAYPEMRRMLDELEVTHRSAPMEMSVTCSGCDLCFSMGRPLSSLIGGGTGAGRMQLGREALRFVRTIGRHSRRPEYSSMSVGDYLDAHGYSQRFASHFLTLFLSAIWTNSRSDVLDYPLDWAIGFLATHGGLGLSARNWRSIDGGSAVYVDAIRARFAGTIHLEAPVIRVQRSVDGSQTLDVIVEGRSPVRFDEVLVCTHADQALALIDATPLEHSVLEAFRYSACRTVLHEDQRVLPTAPRMRASWNWSLDSCSMEVPHGGLTYWMNRVLQLRTHNDRQFFVTLEPPAGRIDPALVLDEHLYRHPVFSRAAAEAQLRISEMQGACGVWFAGSWCGHGFHEAAISSGLAAASSIRSRYRQD